MSDWDKIERFTIPGSHGSAIRRSGGVWCRVLDAIRLEDQARAEGYAQGLEAAARVIESTISCETPESFLALKSAAAIRARIGT